MNLPASKHLLIDVANLTSHPRRWERTGIQEVAYQVLLGSARIRQEFAATTRITLLPFLPRELDRSGSLLPFFDTPAEILSAIEEELRLPSIEIWGFDLRAQGYRLSAREVLGHLGAADAIHFQSLADFMPMLGALPSGRRRLSATFYDLGPVLFPEFTAPGIADWFAQSYLPGLARMDAVYSISQHSARDFHDYFPDFRGELRTLRLPRLQPVGAGGKAYFSSPKSMPYLLFAGSIEPRKNLEAAIAGFERYVELHPSSSLRLAIAGASGWTNERIHRLIQRGAARDRIDLLGFLPPEELAQRLRGAQALLFLPHYEGFGLPVSQAIALGTPVITSLGSSLPEAAAGEAIFVDSSDPMAVAAGIAIVERGEYRRSPPIQESWEDYARTLLQSATRTPSV